MIKYHILTIICLTLAISVFFLFKPFTYLDNDTSSITCQNGGIFIIGPNYIYSFEKNLDQFNDIKARKLCAFGVIRDYINYYKTPEQKNYQLKAAFNQNSSWGDAVIAASAVILFSWFILNLLLGKNLQNIYSSKLLIISILISSLLFIFFLKNPVKKLYCQRQIAQKVVNFRNSAFKYGVISVPDEDKYIKEVTPKIFQSCLQSGF